MRSVARITTDHPRIVLAITTVLVLAGAVFGAAAVPKLSSSGYNDPSSDSAQVAELLDTQYQDEIPHLSIAIGIRGQKNAALGISTRSVARELLAEIADQPEVVSVVSYWNTGQPSLLSKDGSLGLALVYFEDGAMDQKNAIAKEITADIPQNKSGVEIYTGGTGVIYNSINGQITEDLKKAEALSIPLTLLMLLLVFGSAMAAAQPLLVGVSAIAISMFGIWALTFFTEISVFSLNLLTGLGLGLGIDYALLIINRFREELSNGVPTEEAVARTVHTAGRTVMFSGFTVAVTLAGLFILPQPFLKSFAWAGVLVCLLAVYGALVPLPAILRLIGPKIDKWKVRKHIPTPQSTGPWERLARLVMNRPWIVITLTVALLVSLASIATKAEFGQVDHRVLPADHPTVIVTQVWEEDFGGYLSTPIEILLPADYSDTEVADFAKEASLIPLVSRVASESALYQAGNVTQMPTGWQGVTMAADGTVRLRAFADVEPRSELGKTIIDQLRALDSSAKVGGSAAEYADSLEGISRQLPWALLWVGVFTLLLLFLFTGSVVLPVKAILLNLLSLGAAIGVLTWVFQYGNLNWLTGDFILTGHLDMSVLVMVVVVTFGLSMDYEVFLLSRIKEEHDAGADTVESVAVGLQRSGRIITAAAALLAVVFSAFITASVTPVKMIGLGIGFAIILDATIVRALLVPALMKVMGRANWWAPKPLRALYRKFGLHD